MPELPEVETIRQGLLKHLPERTITDIYWSGKNLRVAMPMGELKQHIKGRKIVTVDRRAKYILIRTDDKSVIIIHLGMTGKTGIFPQKNPVAKHDHLCLRLDNGLEMRLNDTRRFGMVMVWPGSIAAQMEKEFNRQQGIEPLSSDFKADKILTLAKNRKTPIKTFLMDSRKIAGIGNIYANEGLFAAKISPFTPAGELKKEDWQRLIKSCRKILKQALKAGGTTISDFVNNSGKPGYFQLQLKVYGRQNEPCPKCKSCIKKTKSGGRATFFCPRCQAESDL